MNNILSKAAKNNFRFWFPIDEIEKAVGEDGVERMILGGIASTVRRDTDGESLNPDGFDMAYAKERGIINWSHGKEPSDVIGEPVEITKKANGWYVKSELYSQSKKAKEVWDLAQTLTKSGAKRRLGYSIEGRATQRDPLDPTKVTKAMITNFALTISPKNADSIVDIIKGNYTGWDDNEVPTTLEYETISSPANGGVTYLVNITRPDGTNIKVDTDYNIVVKCLSAGGESGHALQKESLEPEIKNVTYKGETGEEADEDEALPARRLTKHEVLDRILEHNSVISISKAHEIFTILNNLPNMAQDKNKTNAATSTLTNVDEDLLAKALNHLDIMSKGVQEDEIEEDEDDEPLTVVDATATPVVEDDEDDEDEQLPVVVNEPVVAIVGATETLSKGVEFKEFFDSFSQTLSKGLNEQNENQRNFAVVLKGMYDVILGQDSRIKELEGKLEKGFIDIENKIEDLEEEQAQPTGRRSVAASNYTDRNFAATTAAGDVIQKGNTNGAKQVSVSTQRPVLLEMMDRVAYKDGAYNKPFAEALSAFECGGALNPALQKAVQDEFGVLLVK